MCSLAPPCPHSTVCPPAAPQLLQPPSSLSWLRSTFHSNCIQSLRLLQQGQARTWKAVPPDLASAIAPRATGTPSWATAPRGCPMTVLPPFLTPKTPSVSARGVVDAPGPVLTPPISPHTTHPLQAPSALPSKCITSHHSHLCGPNRCRPLSAKSFQWWSLHQSVLPAMTPARPLTATLPHSEGTWVLSRECGGPDGLRVPMPDPRSPAPSPSFPSLPCLCQPLRWDHNVTPPSHTLSPSPGLPSWAGCRVVESTPVSTDHMTIAGKPSLNQGIMNPEWSFKSFLICTCFYKRTWR